MNPQEQQLLDDFLQRLAAVNGVAKDTQAEALIQQRLSGQPDALYLLVQRSMLQQHALDSAKAQIAQLQAQLGGQGGGSFLGGQAGWNQPPQQPYPPQQQYSPQPPPMYAPPAAPSWRERLFGGGNPPPQQGGGGPGFLASAATTAAGVAGGMFLFDGIENLVGGHHGGGGLFGGEQQPMVENVTENNFYDGNNPGQGGVDQDFNQNGADFNNDIDDGSFDDNSWS